MIEAAGLLIRSKEGKILFLKRSDTGEWAFPGGHIEAGETAEEAAVRECGEEIGSCPPGPYVELWRRISEDVDFTTYFVEAYEFEPYLNNEHTAYEWRRADNPPGPLHPGVAEVLDMRMTQFTTDKEPKFYTTEQIGPKQSMTPEGFLLCEDVPIGRLGTLFYKGDGVEVAVQSAPGSGGIVQVERDATELFHPNCLASFAGKDITLDHPPDGMAVEPENWRLLSVGTVLYPRRGEGSQDDLMLADFLIKDPDIIAAVLAKEIKEVSSGYDCDYEQTGPGRGRQIGIIGNHVALVDKGRCGPRCAIGDSEMKRNTLIIPGRRALNGSTAVAVALRAAFAAKDEKAFESLLGKVLTGDAQDPENEEPGAIHIHMGTSDEMTGADIDQSPTDFDDIAGVLGEVLARVDDIENPGMPTRDCETIKDRRVRDAYRATLDKRMADRRARDAEMAAEAEKEAKETADKAMRDAAEGKDPAEESEEGKVRGEGKDGKTRDSASLEVSFHETRARAEILAPGIRFPTFDRRADAKLTVDALCALRRRALTKALDSDEIAPIIRPLTGDSPDLTKMSCDAVAAMFTSSSELVKVFNAGGGGRDAHLQNASSGALNFQRQSKVPSVAEINKRNRDFWAGRA